MPMLKAGDTAPDFTVKAHTGEDVTLSRFRGRWVVLWFYPAASTPGCTIEGCSFRDNKGAFDQKKATIFGVSFDGVEANKKFVDKFNFSYTLLCDTDRKIGVAYGAADDAKQKSARRVSFLIDPQGQVRQVWDRVDVKTHYADVLAAIP